MTVEADIFALLSPLVGGRVFPDLAPTNTTRPYITYQQIGGKVINFTNNETPDSQHGFFQINTWAATRAQATSLAKQIEDAFRGAITVTAQPEAAPTAQHEPELGLYGTIQDFSIWSVR